MKQPTITALTTTIILLSLYSGPTWADLNQDITKLQYRWAEVNYQLQAKPQLAAFKTLVTDAEQVVANYPDAAAAWIWQGIIKSTYAGAKGGLGALSLAKESRKDLEQALSIEPEALDGSAYTSLGTLYFNVPGWPIGFGNDKKAEEFLLKALAINPNGIDSNYFFGDYLIHEKRFQEAKVYLLKAQKAVPRPKRPLADAGRQKEIANALAIIDKELSH
jgi:tetratricopeptide (TPR) repeat protein